VVDPESNYCFGEGGAGTYSDGKLYTRADKRGPVADVLRTLVEHGAPQEILIDARPHIGSNKLPKVVMRLRETLAAAGSAVRFDARVVGLEVDAGRVRGVRLASGEEIAAAAALVAAGGRARDVWVVLAAAGAVREPGELMAAGHEGVFAGVEFQAAIERRPAALGGGGQVAPAQRLTDFIAGRESSALPRSSYRPGICSAPLHAELPPVLAQRLRA